MFSCILLDDKNDLCMANLLRYRSKGKMGVRFALASVLSFLGFTLLQLCIPAGMESVNSMPKANNIGKSTSLDFILHVYAVPRFLALGTMWVTGLYKNKTMFRYVWNVFNCE